MTTTSINAVGFCAHYSKQGDWAFQRALALARNRDLQMNIFHFVQDPYEQDTQEARNLSKKDLDRIVVEREKELRLYYDDKLGDWLKAGFRLCEDNGWTELHRCICNREFQVLILPYPNYGSKFAGRLLTSFANAMTCPTILVGPTRPDEVYLNSPAVLMADKLLVTDTAWSSVEAPSAAQGEIANQNAKGLD